MSDDSGKEVVDLLSSTFGTVLDQEVSLSVLPCATACEEWNDWLNFGDIICLREAIMHINDEHFWSYNQIAEWLDQLPIKQAL